MGRRWLYAWGVGATAVGAASLLVPLYVVRLGGSPVDLGLLGAVAALVGTPGAIVWGRLADRTAEPRAVVVLSLAGVGVLLGAMPLVSSVAGVVALNALLWLVFAAAGPVLTLLVVADAPTARWSREIALLNTYQGYGWAGGLLAGIVWSTTVGRALPPTRSIRYLFVACALAGLAAAVLFHRWLPSPGDRQLRRVEPDRVARLLGAGRRGVRGATFLFNPNRLFWTTRRFRPSALADRFTPTLAAYFLGVLLFFSGFAAFFAPLPLFLTDVGYSADPVFALYLVSSLGSAAFYEGAGRLSERLDLRALQTGALGLRGLAMPLVAVVGVVFAAGGVGTLLAGATFLLIGATWAVVAVTAGTIVARIAPADVRGEALGLYAGLSTLAGGVGSAGGGLLAEVAGFVPSFAAAGATILVGAVVVATLRGISTRTGAVAGTPVTEEAPSEG